MAVSAIGELLQHGRRMLTVVARQTGRDHLVLRVAGGTGQLMVTGLACLQQPEGIKVTGRAIFCRQRVRIRDGQRLMGPVTGDTVGLNHLWRMRLVALNTLRDTSMRCCVAFDARHALMPGLAGTEGFENPFVAGAAIGRCDLVAKNRRSRTVRGVTTPALVGGHARSMRLMALAAQGDILMHASVAGVAGKFFMPGWTVDQGSSHLPMAAVAIPAGDRRGEGYRQRFVRLMTVAAAVPGHLRPMRFMTIAAGRHMAMLSLMAGGTGKRTVIARKILQLPPLLGVAGQAGRRKILAEGDLQRFVRIFVAAQTPVEAIMRRPGLAVTEAAGGDNFQLVGRMAGVAVQTSDAGLVGHAGRLDIPGRIPVAFAAIVDGKRRLLGLGDCRQIADTAAICRQGQTASKQKKENFYSHFPLRGHFWKNIFIDKSKKTINFKDICWQQKFIKKTAIRNHGPAYNYCRVELLETRKVANILPLEKS